MITEVAIVAITIISGVLIINNVLPTIQEGKDIQAFTDAKQTLKAVDAMVNQLMLEAPGSRRSIDVNLPKGRFVFSGTEDKIAIKLEDTTLLQPGVRIEEEGVSIQGGGTVTATDNGTDFVLENSAVLFSIKKIGSSGSYATLNTSNMITAIRNKRSGITIVPASGIFINDTAASSVGNGYTELGPSGLQTAAINVHMNSSVTQYDAIFTLAAANDFVKLEVKNIKAG